MNINLSVIVPVYNVEEYLEKCIESIEQQDIPYEEYEVIIVNDGSVDRSLQIAEQLETRYKNIEVYSQPNGGLSAARNKGLKYAKGKYVWFVDSDDWIEPDALKNIFPYLNDDLDVLEIQYQNVYDGGRIEKGETGSGLYSVVSGREATLAGGIHTPAPFSIFRNNFLKDNNLLFEEGIYHEDSEFRVRSLLLAQTVMSTPSVCYNYLQRTSGSITARFKLKNGLDMLFVLNRHYNFVQQYDNDVKIAIYKKIGMWMNSILLGIRQLGGDEYETLFQELKASKNLFYAMRHSGNLKYIIEGSLLDTNVRLGLKIHSVLR